MLTPARPTNTALWTRESLAQHEVEKLIEVTKRNRPGRRRYAHDLPILVYRHEAPPTALGARRLQNGDAALHCITVVRPRISAVAVWLKPWIASRLWNSLRQRARAM